MDKKKRTHKFSSDVERKAICLKICADIPKHPDKSLKDIIDLNGISQRQFNFWLKRDGFEKIKEKYEKVYEKLTRQAPSAKKINKRTKRYSEATKRQKVTDIMDGYAYTDKTLVDLCKDQKIPKESFYNWVESLGLESEWDVCGIMAKAINKEFERKPRSQESERNIIRSFARVCKYYTEYTTVKIPTVVSLQGEQLYRHETGFLTLANCCFKVGIAEGSFYYALSTFYDRLESMWEEVKIKRVEMIRLARINDIHELMELSRQALKYRMQQRTTHKQVESIDQRIAFEIEYDEEGNMISKTPIAIDIHKQRLEIDKLEVDLPTLQYVDKLTGTAPTDTVQIEGKHLHLHTTDAQKVEEVEKKDTKKIKKLRAKRNKFRSSILGDLDVGESEVMEEIEDIIRDDDLPTGKKTIKKSKGKETKEEDFKI